MAHRVDGKAGGPGLLWGAEPAYRLLRVNRTKSSGRVAPLVPCICPLAREGLVSGHLVPPATPTSEEIILEEVTWLLWHLGKLAPSFLTCRWRAGPECPLLGTLRNSSN